MVCLEAFASPCELRDGRAADAEVLEVAVGEAGKLAHGATRFLVTCKALGYVREQAHGQVLCKVRRRVGRCLMFCLSARSGRGGGFRPSLIYDIDAWLSEL